MDQNSGNPQPVPPMAQNSGNPHPAPPPGSGRAPTVAGARSYVLGWLTALGFTMTATNAKTARCHDVQNTFQ